ncbi:hypothetical protein SteCoe_36173 [Stentor coeruleus]|uniref:protein-disulfide reductase n=1 Tax=Stentor coeruleus TaxID=5963 RepID=A0A1R2AQM6_9CILI|nr:hypothetical protein SteCoe_36173 [Stentor coeruleus]
MDINPKKLELVRNAGRDSGEIDPGCLIGFYFAAHWFPAARNFLPKLTAAYTAINTPQKRLEIVFVSFDRNEDTFEAYSVDMPWLSVPFKNEILRVNLAQKFQITDTFRLVITTPTLQVISPNAIDDIKTKATQAYDYWESISSNVKGFADSPYCEKNHIMTYIDVSTKSKCVYCRYEVIKGWTCLECKISTCMICQEYYSNSTIDEAYKIMCFKSHNMRKVIKINDYYMSRFLNSKYTCRTCNQTPDDGTGLHCFLCIFDMCFNCSKSVCEDKYLAHCPNGHEVLWVYELCAKILEKYERFNFRCETCGESYMGGGAFACLSCEYYVCVPCVKKANTPGV